MLIIDQQFFLKKKLLHFVTKNIGLYPNHSCGITKYWIFEEKNDR